MVQEKNSLPERDFSSISPSAKALLLMKGLTKIPFAREAAELIMFPEKYEPDFANPDFGFWTRVVHFEHRYASVNQLLEELSIKNILELSSGFSFRGLDMVGKSDVHYIDTDLPELIEKKKDMIGELQKNYPGLIGKLDLHPLNALDENQFNEVVNLFDEGEIVIVNEGLLMYLNLEEKAKLLKIIHNVLLKRGGYWITADVYIKFTPLHSVLKVDDKLQQFFDEHRIEENKFESIEAAESFLGTMGFVIEKEANPDYSKLSTISYMMKNAKEEHLNSLGKSGKIHATWRLRAK